MNKILIIDTTWPINSRTERFRRTFKEHFHVAVVAWNRGKKNIEKKEKNYVLDTEIGYGNQLKKLFMLPIFFMHIYSVNKIEKPDILFASHWDSLICAVILKLIGNWKIKIVYDCLDLPTSSNTLIRKVIVYIERICLYFVILTIFASRYFKPLYPEDLTSYVFENYPSFSLLDGGTEEPCWIKYYNQETTEIYKNVAWIGVVRYFNIIENILLAIKDTNIHFFVFGDGPDLEKVIEAVNYHHLNDQVVFFGRYRTSELKYIYERSDLVWAAYPTNDFNAIYAISNKYFECSFFEKRIILSRKTKMAEGIKENPNVILVDEYSSTDIKEKILSHVNSNTYIKYENDMFWEDKEEEFIDFLKGIMTVNQLSDSK